MSSSSEQKKAVQDALTLLARLPNFSGVALVLVTDNYANVQVHKFKMHDEFLDKALAEVIDRRALSRSPIILPASAGVAPKGGRFNGSG